MDRACFELATRRFSGVRSNAPRYLPARATACNNTRERGRTFSQCGKAAGSFVAGLRVAYAERMNDTTHSVQEGNGYVCAFRGRRDNYQAPLALAEAGRLDRFITDFYTPSTLLKASSFFSAGTRAKLDFRHHPAIPRKQVQCLWGQTVREAIQHRRGVASGAVYGHFDARFSLKASGYARQHRSNLFLYNPYAYEAFRAKYAHTPHRLMFQFHPHPDLEARVLTEDRERYNQVEQSYTSELRANVPEYVRMRERDCWKYADLVVCASTFTRTSLLEVGLAPEQCVVVPYGVDLPDLVGHEPAERFQALFVGSGVQRKGLHHLIEVWGRANLPEDSELIVVCRNIDSGIRGIMDGVKGIRLISGVSSSELAELFESSSLFVMPSLVEGFGQVYLEALSYGCPVLGTPNTCVPDLGDESDGVFVVESGDLDGLQAQLERLSVSLLGQEQPRQAARACAERFTWSAFRENLTSHFK